MTKELAVEVKTQIEVALARLLQATCLAPSGPEQQRSHEQYKNVHQLYTDICSEHDITWRDAATSARIATGIQQ